MRGRSRRLCNAPVRNDPLRGNIHKTGTVGNLVGNRLDAVMSVLSDEFVNLFVSVTINHQVLRTFDDQAVDFDDFGAPQYSLC